MKTTTVNTSIQYSDAQLTALVGMLQQDVKVFTWSRYLFLVSPLRAKWLSECNLMANAPDLCAIYILSLAYLLLLLTHFLHIICSLGSSLCGTCGIKGKGTNPFKPFSC